MKWHRFFVATCLATISGVASAQTVDVERNRGNDRTKAFTELDADRSDWLDRQEVRVAYPGADFDDMDQDDDGKVNRNEYFQYHRR